MRTERAMRMSEPFHVAVGLVLQRNETRYTGSTVFMNMIRGRKFVIKSMQDGNATLEPWPRDLYANVIYRYTLPTSEITAEWFIPD